MSLQFKFGFIVFALVAVRWSSPGLAQTAQPTGEPAAERQILEFPAASSGTDQVSKPPSPASISGTIVDQSGAVVAGAQVNLSGKDHVVIERALSGTDGQFFFPNVAPGPFHLTITSTGFATQTSDGTLHSGEVATISQIVLTVAENVTEVQVGVSQIEVAEEQIKVQEKQRVLGAIPNFYVSYDPAAVSLSPKQKFELAVKSVVDPFTFVVVAGTAGVQQAQNHFREYGQGAQGYAKRFGAVYADTLTSTFIGGAILPSILKQDPRYFYKGTGSKTSRSLYAVANAVICKGDNGRWQANYSGLLGSLAAGGISNLYYPKNDREGADLTFENAGIGIGTTALSNLLQEFLIRHLTPKAPKNNPFKP
jgi:hypothetical protein